MQKSPSPVTCDGTGKRFIVVAEGAKRLQRHRARLCDAGLRPVQIWVPDTRRPGFAEESRRQSRLLRGDPPESETLAWLDDVADTRGWE
jgi:hypothetical protein